MPQERKSITSGRRSQWPIK